MDVLSNEAAAARKTFGVFASNSGNFLFTHAVHRALSTPDTEVISDSLTTERTGVTEEYISRINDEFDAFIVPLANAFRESFRPALRRLTNVIEKLDIPVVVTGVGAQVGLNGDVNSTSPELDYDCRKFVAAVLDRSASIGVRGDITADYLSRLGFESDSIDVIGCPSLHDFEGTAPQVVRKLPQLDANGRLAINISPQVSRIAEVLQWHYERFPNLVYIPQNHPELLLLLWGQEIRNFPPGLPSSVDHPMYRDGKIRFFADAEPWKKFLSQQDFAFGTRIHGNIAALASGTPAMLLAHDSRTLELARFHGMPYIEMPSDPTQVDASKLYSETELSEFNARRAPNRASWHEFLQRNRVPSIHDKGCSNPDYTRLLEATSHPGAALPVSAASREELAARLRWIWQGIQADQYRPFEAYEPRFEPRTQARRSSHEIATAVEKETKRIRAEVADLTSAVRAAQKTSVQAQTELDDFKNYLGVPFERRVLRALKHRLRRLFKRF